MNDAELLQKAKNILIESGWHQGSFGDVHDPTDSHCMVGAVYTVQGENEMELSNDWRQYFYPWLFNMDVPMWNDIPGREFSHVMEVFDQAILLAKEGNR